MSTPEDDKIDEKIMAIKGAFTRKIEHIWIDPAKSRPYFEDLRRVFFRDDSPSGLYTGCIVPEHLLGKIVAIIPLPEFLEFLDAWKQVNTTYVNSLKKIQ